MIEPIAIGIFNMFPIAPRDRLNLQSLCIQPALFL
jgi:hypothetical protein